MADPSHKKRVRGGHRASATKMIRKAEDYLAEEPVNYSQLARIRLSLQEKVSVLKHLDSEIVDLVKGEEVADEIDSTDTYMEDVYDMMAKLERLFDKTSPPPRATASATRDDASARETKVKLPKLTIQPFKGELTAWTTFWDAYEVAIHSNRSLSDIERFNYLRSLLQGPALDAITGLTLTAANYREAVEVLSKRFGNKQRIIDKHMEALLSLDAVPSDTNLKALRHLYDAIESQVRGLKSMGVTPETYGSLLSSVVVAKIPPEIRLIISRKIGDGDRKLDDLMAILLDEVQARERAAASDVSPVKSRERSGRNHSTAAALLASTGGGPLACYYCQQPHLASACKSVTAVEERKRILREAGRCFVCLRRGHVVRQCTSRGRCSHCRGRHHGSICGNQKPAEGEAKPPDSREGAPVKTNPSGTNPAAAPFKPDTSTTLWTNSSQAVLLQTAKAAGFNPANPKRSGHVRVVFDTGSQRSYVTEHVARNLSLVEEGEQPLTILTFGSNREQTRVCKFVTMGLASRDGMTKQLRLFVVPTICEPIACQPISFCQSDFSHLAGIDLADASDGNESMKVDILIGSDQYWELVTGETRRGDTGPVAIRTMFGWVLSGPTSRHVADAAAACLVTHTLRVDGLSRESQVLDDRLRSFWDLESFGIIDATNAVHDEFTTTVQQVEGRYEVQLPWREGHPVLHDNYQLSLKRLHGLMKRLKQDPAILHEYDATIKSQMQQGIVEIVKCTDEPPERVHYLPHHAVVRRNKETTKVRVVYDASARADGPSLNECLHVGPKLNQKILDVLLRFRVHRVAIVADIEKAFLMVSVAKKDRDVLRFLWFKDACTEHQDLIELRFSRVVFGVSSSPFLLNATIQHHLQKYETEYPDLVGRLRRSLYVDDLATGAESEEQAYEMFVSAKEIMKEAGFNLRKFYTNSRMFQARVNPIDCLEPVEDRRPLATEELEESYASLTLGSGQRLRQGEQKVLGVRWDTSSDQLLFNLEEIASTAKVLTPTKRTIVSLVGSFYDPLGYLAPVVVHFKIFLRQLCKAKLDWDQPLPPELLKEWMVLSQSLQYTQPSSITRGYLSGLQGEPISYTLCGFCDASEKAYAGVVYLLVETRSYQSVKFVAAKTRVAPLQSQTIPRLELLSAVLLARLLSAVTQSLQSELQLCPPHCYTDSTVSLCWIKGINKTWKVFVQNRVNEIRKLTPPDCWRHCPGKDNPADIPSRGLTPLELSVSTLWQNGPPWLGEGEPRECDGEEDIHLPEECVAELKGKDQQLAHGLLTTDSAARLSRVIDCERFESLDRLIATTALVLRFCRILLSRVRAHETVATHDLDGEAERLWISECQRTVVADKNFAHWQKQFDLFQDESGVWRCRGRIQNAAVPYSTKHPVLLPRNHHLTALLVLGAHRRVFHNGVKETLTELRSRFWIVKGRSLVKKVVHQCNVCRRHEGGPFGAPRPPPLPGFRVEEAPPFTFTGVDFAGPLYVKGEAGMKKVWIRLYTCCVVRAVHLDLVSDQTTPAFLRCFKRFVARRGLPLQMVSDNGKTFKAAAKALRDVKWVFNVPKAPWWGGVFERMVRCVKRCLRKMVGQAKLLEDELLTSLVEVEAVLNSRPLTVVSAEDLEEPLTPSHLIVGRRLLSSATTAPCPEPDEFQPGTVDDLTRRSRYLNAALDHFWRRWSKEYLIGLREMHSHYKKSSRTPRVAVGDVVIIHSDDQPRGMWRLGKVEELLTGPDGEHRAAVLRVAGQGRSAKRLRRPVQRLYPLECSVPKTQSPNPSESSASAGEDASDERLPVAELPRERDPPARRSERVASQVARDRLLAHALESGAESDEC